jgi:hypothetical protein
MARLVIPRIAFGRSQHSVAIPAKAGILQPRGFSIDRRRLWNTGSPASRAMTAAGDQA